MNTSRYAVRKLGWHQPPHGDPYTRRVPAANPVASFDTFDEAEAHRRALEAEAREGENPFRFGGASIFFQSSLDGPRLHDWLMDEAIDPPASELRHSDWRAWWDAFAHTWSPHQLAHAWAAFDKVRFFEAVEDAPFTAHVAVEVVPRAYEYTPRTNADREANPEIERGRLVAVSRKPIDVMRARRRAGRRALTNRYAVLPVPSDVPPFAGAAFLVQRRVVVNPTYLTERDEPPSDARVPLALFATREGANAHRDRLAAEALRTVNPFVFLTEDADAFDRRDEFAQVGMPLPLPSAMTRPYWLDGRREWLEWYDLCQDEAADGQRARVWELCDAPLFEVLPVEVLDG